jgi:hypothetical protein
MRTYGLVLGAMLFVVSASSAGAQTHAPAQTHAVPPSALDAMVQRHTASLDAERADVQRVLNHPDVKGVAQTMGVDLKDASSAIATLDATELARIATQARQVEQALAGGQSSITISTTLIIIGLLILILIIVAV